MNSWIDMHAHLDKLEESSDLAIQRAQSEGVSRIVTIATDPEDLAVVLKLSQDHPGQVFCTLGIHPHEGKLYTESIGAFIEANLSDKGVIAVGEIGLDYYYTLSAKEDQIGAFRSQLDIAKKYKYPVEIHTRDAEQDTIDILRAYNGEVQGLIHCFTGTEWLARQALDLGFNISISGVVTFKNAQSLRDIVKNVIPLDRIHVETDAPFLSPVPVRGMKNTPAHVVHTGKLVAELKGVSEEKLKEQTWQNAKTLFPKLY